MTPPLALISSTAINTTSRSDTSLIAIVPLNEWSTPILIGSLSAAYDRAQCPKLPSNAAMPTPAVILAPCTRKSRREEPVSDSSAVFVFSTPIGSELFSDIV